MKRNVKIVSMHNATGERKVSFGNQVRHWVGPSQTQLGLAVEAAKGALSRAGLTVDDLDCIVSASAVNIQPIPCNAVLISEQLSPVKPVPCLDINTTCTSFISALDIMSYLVEAGRYARVLIVSSDVSSLGTNPEQKESHELFSDAASAFIIEKSTGESHVGPGMQKTWVEGAHDTEIRGGLTGLPARDLGPGNQADFQFDMKGRKVLFLAARALPELLEDLKKRSGQTLADVDFIVPHQASEALGMIMKRIGVPKTRYIDRVQEWGNMVSASVPYSFCRAVEEGRIQRGDKIALIGTAAGLTANVLMLQY